MGSTHSIRRFLKADLWEEWKTQETDQRKGIKPPAPQKPYPQDTHFINMVSPDNFTVGQMSLLQVIKQRRSCREFTDDPLSLEELSFLCWATQGVNQEATRSLRERLADLMKKPVIEIANHLRTVPSGGACHPFETYLLVNRVEGLTPGLYRYLSFEHKLCFITGETALMKPEVGKLPKMLSSSAVVFIWTAIPYRTEWRYSIVAPKIIAQDSGHLCQNLYLACEAIGAGTCAVGAYNQKQMDALLGVDGEDEFTIYVAPVGKR